MHGGHFVNRMVWKFQGWLQAYNDGPLRMPTQRIHDAQMLALRKGLLDSGLQRRMDPFREFFIGRHPASSDGGWFGRRAFATSSSQSPVRPGREPD